ncbi:MAG: hypothetical protein NZ585_10515 [Chloracidobacterium sp.]|nr:hypothetical protein [Chloracidobacterium sp.]MDW8217787.1 hypothetical protein [Acidobacteriota bacterium]
MTAADHTGPSDATQHWRLLRHPLLWIMLGYLALGLSLLRVFQFQINPDGVAYLDIAEKYARGNLCGAVNAYWSPLLSWLTTVLRLVGLPPQIAVKLVLLGSGAAALGGLWRLTHDLPTWMRTVAVTATVPMTLHFALSVITPDLLVAEALVWYVFVLIKNDASPPGWWYGLRAGTIGAVAYMAKAFALPFFLAHWTVWCVLEGRYRRLSMAAFVGGLAAFCVLGGLWVAALRWKYGVWMTGSAGRYNWAWSGPRMSFVHPTETAFFAPFEPGDTSAWTDPTRLPIQSWSVLESAEFAHYQVAMTLERLRAIGFSYLPEFFLPTLPLLLVAAGVAWRQSETETGRRCRAALSAFVVYVAGYALIYVEARHLWTLAYWLCAMLAWLSAWGMRRYSRKLWAAAFILCSALFVWQPAWALWKAAQGKDEGLQVCRALYRTAQVLRERFGVQGKLASNAEWHYSLYLAYFLGGRYYGVAPVDATPNAVARALDAYQVDYYLVWSDETGRFPTVVWGTEITGGDPHLRLYRAASGSGASH